jgi:hypothetical protein
VGVNFVPSTTQYNSTIAQDLGNSIDDVVPATLACWYRTPGEAGTAHMNSIYNNGISGNSSKLTMAINSDETLTGQIKGTTGATRSVNSSALSLNTWTHCCFVSLNSTSRSIYVNGTADKTTNTQGIGATTNGIDQYDSLGINLKGVLAELSVWDVALSDAEIDFLASGFSAPFVQPLNLRV